MCEYVSVVATTDGPLHLYAAPGLSSHGDARAGWKVTGGAEVEWTGENHDSLTVRYEDKALADTVRAMIAEKYPNRTALIAGITETRGADGQSVCYRNGERIFTEAEAGPNAKALNELLSVLPTLSYFKPTTECDDAILEQLVAEHLYLLGTYCKDARQFDGVALRIVCDPAATAAAWAAARAAATAAALAAARDAGMAAAWAAATAAARDAATAAARAAAWAAAWDAARAAAWAAAWAAARDAATDAAWDAAWAATWDAATAAARDAATAAARAAATAAARDAATDAARAAAWDAAWAAARAAAWAAGMAAARDAGMDAAWDAAWAAARDAATAAARAAAWAAAWDAARAAAWDAARAAAWDAQHLVSDLPNNPWAPLVEIWALGAVPIGVVDDEFVVYVPFWPKKP